MTEKLTERCCAQCFGELPSEGPAEWVAGSLFLPFCSEACRDAWRAEMGANPYLASPRCECCGGPTQTPGRFCDGCRRSFENLTLGAAEEDRNDTR